MTTKTSQMILTSMFVEASVRFAAPQPSAYYDMEFKQVAGYSGYVSNPQP